MRLGDQLRGSHWFLGQESVLDRFREESPSRKPRRCTAMELENLCGLRRLQPILEEIGKQLMESVPAPFVIDGILVVGKV